MPKVVDPEERREALAAAAEKVIATAGIEGAKLRDVAAAAGWTTGLLNHYFEDKRDLLLFTFQSSVERRRSVFEQAIEAARAGAPTLEELQEVLEQVLPLDDERRQQWLVWLAFWGQAISDEALAQEHRTVYRGFRAIVASLLKHARRSGHVHADIDPVREAERLVALIDGVALQAVFDPESWPAEHQVDILAEHLAQLRR